MRLMAYSSAGRKGTKGIVTVSCVVVTLGTQVSGNVRLGNMSCAKLAVGAAKMARIVAVKARFFIFSPICMHGEDRAVCQVLPDRECLDLIDCCENIILSKMIRLKNRVM